MWHHLFKSTRKTSSTVDVSNTFVCILLNHLFLCLIIVWWFGICHAAINYTVHSYKNSEIVKAARNDDTIFCKTVKFVSRAVEWRSQGAMKTSLDTFCQKWFWIRLQSSHSFKSCNPGSFETSLLLLTQFFALLFSYLSVSVSSFQNFCTDPSSPARQETWRLFRCVLRSNHHHHHFHLHLPLALCQLLEFYALCAFEVIGFQQKRRKTSQGDLGEDFHWCLEYKAQVDFASVFKTLLLLLSHVFHRFAFASYLVNSGSQTLLWMVWFTESSGL